MLKIIFDRGRQKILILTIRVNKYMLKIIFDKGRQKILILTILPLFASITPNNMHEKFSIVFPS